MCTCIALLCLLASMACSHQESSGPLRVAVASNFAGTAQSLALEFEKINGTRVEIIPGSTGTHFARITSGAPYDVFLAADDERPLRLEQTGHAVPGTRFTYATGRLAVWFPSSLGSDRQLDDRSVKDALISSETKKIAIANPKLAPYGTAAVEVLKNWGIYDAVEEKLVYGENVIQTLQFADSGGVDAGFVAGPLLETLGKKGDVYTVERGEHGLISQDAVLIRDSETARQWLGFLRSPKALKLIESAGYLTK